MSRQKKYLSGPTKTVRLPAALSDYLLLYAESLDRALVEAGIPLLTAINLEFDINLLLPSAHMQAGIDHSTAIFVAALGAAVREFTAAADPQADRDLEPEPSSLPPHASSCAALNPLDLAS